MADTVTIKKITDLPENTDANDADLFMQGVNGTASLRKIKWSTILAKIKSKLLANNLTTTQEGYALDARQGKALSDQINALNTKTNPQDIEISLGPKFTGNAYAKKIGYIIMVDMELTPSSAVANDDLVMSGLPTPTGGAFYTVLTTGNGNYTAIINTNGELRIYFPGYTDASRVDCGLCYICA